MNIILKSVKSFDWTIQKSKRLLSFLREKSTKTGWACNFTALFYLKRSIDFTSWSSFLIKRSANADSEIDKAGKYMPKVSITCAPAGMGLASEH